LLVCLLLSVVLGSFLKKADRKKKKKINELFQKIKSYVQK
jgi:hypothetical protein